MSIPKDDGVSRRLAPMDWIHTRPHGKLVLDAGRDAENLVRNVMPFMNERDYHSDPQSAVRNALLIYAHDKSGTPHHDTPTKSVRFWDQQMAIGIMNWSHRGRNIFTLDGEVCEALRHTDMGDASAADLVHPYQNYYLHFELERDIVLPSGRVFEGVMVQAADEEVTRSKATFLTIMARAPEHPGTWPHMDDWGYEIEIPDHETETPLVIALERIQSSQGSFPEDGGADVQPYPAEMIPQAREIVELVVNAIMYISRYAGDARSLYPACAPRDLKKAAEGGKRSAERDLGRLGHMRTRLITFGNAGGGKGGEGTGRGVRTHWRRGHWRRQRHGPKSSLTKLILVPPVRVAYRGTDEGPETRRYV